MWAAAAWLNDPAFASEDAVAKLAAEDDWLLERLSIGHSNTLTSRVAFYQAFNVRPSLEYSPLVLDSIHQNSSELRYGRALYPWLVSVSWISANAMDREIISSAEIAIGTVQDNPRLISTAPSSLATECQREVSQVILPWLRFADLAQELLIDSPFDPHLLVEQIQKLQINISVADYIRLLSEPHVGRRIAAYARLAAQPVSDPRIVSLILDTLPHEGEDKFDATVKFALYWSLKAIAAGQESATIVMPYRERLLAARASLPPNSEGVFLIDKILAAEPVALSGVTASPKLVQQFAILSSSGKDANVSPDAPGEWLFCELFHQALATMIQSEKVVTLQSVFDYIANQIRQEPGSAAPLLFLSSHPGLGQFPLLNLATDGPPEPNQSNKRRAILISAVNYPVESETHLKTEAVLAITANMLHAGGNFDASCLLGDQASKASLLELVHKSNQQAAPGDTLLLYFSGHTVDLGDGVLRMFLADSDSSEPASAMSGPELAALIRQGNSTNNILVFDTEMATSLMPYFQT